MTDTLNRMYSTPLTPNSFTLSLLLMVLVSVFSGPSFAASTQFTATVDRTSLSQEETLTLKLRFYEQVLMGEPDLSQLEQNFDVLGKYRNQQYHSVNGKTESWTQWRITLAPKKDGQLLIPSFEFKNSFTDAISIDVKKPTQYSGKVDNQPVFMEVHVDKSSAFVQEQIIYSIRLFTSVDLHSLNRSDLIIDDAVLKKVSENQYQKNINGRPYGVVEMKYAVFPQKSGSLTIPSTLWSVVLNQQNYRRDPFFGRSGKKINLRTPEKTISVLPQPSNYDAAVWIPATEITLKQQWSQDPDHFKVGEPITRTITVNAKGLTAAQLPPLSIDSIDGLSYYPDKPQSEERLADDGVTTIKSESYAIVANKPGSITLPAVVIQWWDTKTKRMQESRLPVQTIHVAQADASSLLPAIADASPNQVNTTVQTSLMEEPKPSSFWIYSTLLTSFTTLIFLFLWLKARSQQGLTPALGTEKKVHKASISNSSAFNALVNTLNQSDSDAVREALILWGQVHFKAPKLRTLKELGELSGDARFAEYLLAVDNQLYGNEERRLPPALVEELQIKLKEIAKNSDSHTEVETLNPLY